MPPCFPPESALSSYFYFRWISPLCKANKGEIFLFCCCQYSIPAFPEVQPGSPAVFPAAAAKNRVHPKGAPGLIQFARSAEVSFPQQPEQLPHWQLSGQPIHLRPLFFALKMYPRANPRIQPITAIRITFSISISPIFSAWRFFCKAEPEPQRIPPPVRRPTGSLHPGSRW